VNRTRRQWLQAAAAWAACPSLRGARNDFWDSKDPASWSNEEKQVLLSQSPWAREGLAKMEEQKQNHRGYEVPLPDTRPGASPGSVNSVPMGEAMPPPPPKPGGRPVQFRVLARWETAKPVRLAGAPEVPELTGQYYVIRLRGLPLMPPPKVKAGEAAPPDPNEGMLQAIQAGSRLERLGKDDIPCAHLFKGSGNGSADVLLFFPRGADPITLADKAVTLEGRFSVFHLSIKFPVRDMVYKGELAL
jgi:hypothetical protein